MKVNPKDSVQPIGSTIDAELFCSKSWRRVLRPNRGIPFKPLFLFGLVGLAQVSLGARDASQVLRIGLAERASEVRLGPGVYWITGKGFERKVSWTKEVRWIPTIQGFRFGNKSWPRKSVVTPVPPGDVVLFNGRPYRGRLDLLSDGKTARVINALGVEPYLRGVLHRETSEGWPTEALKAQSVISRTYALLNRGRHVRSGYDLCSRPHCQTYGGVADERSATDAVLRRTRGEVLVDRRGRLVSAVYHSCCGGSTESAENVWERGRQPYLRAVRCDWCRKSPHSLWRAEVPSAVVTARLNAAGYALGDVRAIGILSRTASGRVYQFRVYGERGTRDIHANTFRNLVDPRRIRSTKIAGVSKSEKGLWRFHGRGWGHGVGLCQWGMKELADQSMSYGQILRIYYRGVEVVDWKE